MMKKENKRKQSDLVEAFSESIVNDVHVNAYIATRYPEKINDLAYANSLAFAKIKPAERIFNPATRIMAALLTKVNIGIVKGVLRTEEENAISQLTKKLDSLKEKIVTTTTTEEKSEIGEVTDEATMDMIQILESHGPILEAPSLPYTERIGPCSVYSQSEFPSELEIEGIFKKSLDYAGRNPRQWRHHGVILEKRNKHRSMHKLSTHGPSKKPKKKGC